MAERESGVRTGHVVSHDMRTRSPYRLAVLSSHPIQYFTPLYRRIAGEPDIDLMVYFCSRVGLEDYVDEGFGRRLHWDVPLLEGYPHRFLPNMGSGRSVSTFLSLINPAILAELWRERPDALWVHGHNYVTNLMAVAAANILRVPVLMRGETHLLLRRSPAKAAIRRPLMTLFYRHLCAACLAIGTRNREFYRAHGVPDDRIVLVPYTVDNDFFRTRADEYRSRAPALKSELRLPVDKTIILYASKLIARKRPMDLLRAFHRLRKTQLDVALLFVGSGEEEQELRHYVAENAVADVHFFGFRNQSELPKFYAIADIFVLPAQDEPWGLIVNEVMAAGLPVVLTEEIGAAADVVRHGETGFVYGTGDIDALAWYLETLAGDEGLRSRMSRRSRDLIDTWDFERCVGGVRAALGRVSAS